ncbi:hypothetical protein [Streptomyces sasae]|nr:hypothetical protein [Streptomyces sasae]
MKPGSTAAPPASTIQTPESARPAKGVVVQDLSGRLATGAVRVL